jgi:hypothetical protein
MAMIISTACFFTPIPHLPSSFIGVWASTAVMGVWCEWVWEEVWREGGFPSTSSVSFCYYTTLFFLYDYITALFFFLSLCVYACVSKKSSS